MLQDEDHLWSVCTCRHLILMSLDVQHIWEGRLQLHSTTTWTKHTESNSVFRCLEFISTTALLSSLLILCIYEVNAQVCTSRCERGTRLFYLRSESSPFAGRTDGSMSGKGNGQTSGLVLTGLLLTHQPALWETHQMITPTCCEIWKL